MSKLPWTKWFSREWLSEKTIAKTTLAARGLWIEALNVMIANNTYKLEGSRQEMATLLRCSVGDLNGALPNLHASNVGVVTLESTGYVTLESRRLKRECIARENGRKRISKFRENGGCNASKRSLSESNSESNSDSQYPEGGSGETESAFHQLRGEIGEHFKRPETQAWSYEEQRLLSEICKSPTAVHEWHTLLSFRSKVKEFQRQTLVRLLENWGSELDKARTYEPPAETDRYGKPVKPIPPMLRMPGVPDWMAKEAEGL